MVFITCHSFHKKRGLDIFLPHSYSSFLCRKVCCKKTFTLLWQEAHKIALKNLAQEEQLPRHHLNSACDFIYAIFFRKLRPVRHFSSQLRFTSSNVGEYYPTSSSVATKIKCWVGRERMPNKILIPILLLADYSPGQETWHSLLQSPMQHKVGIKVYLLHAHRCF